MDSTSESDTAGCGWKCCLLYFIEFVVGLVVLNLLILYLGPIVGTSLFIVLFLLAVGFKWIHTCDSETNTEVVQQRPCAVINSQRDTQWHASTIGAHQPSWTYNIGVQPSRTNNIGYQPSRSNNIGVQPSRSNNIGFQPSGSSNIGVRTHSSRPSVSSLPEEPISVLVSGPDKDLNSDRVALVVARDMNCSLHKAQTLIQMLTEGKTIPFLVRYRKGVVGDWSPKDMRKLKEVYENAKNVVSRAVNIKRNIAASGQLNEHVENEIDNARTMTELDEIFDLYKPVKKSSLSTLRVITVAADQILNRQPIDVQNLSDSHYSSTSSREDEKTLLTTFLTHAILRRISDVPWPRDDWTLHSVKISSKEVEDDKQKFKKYYDFRQPVRNLKAAEVLAINRGVKKNILKVTLTPGNNLKAEMERTMNKVIGNGHSQKYVNDILKEAATAAQKMLIAKLSKMVPTNITKSAEETAIEVFSSNLKRLLLIPPYLCDHEFNVLGIDPGMTHGCKSVIVDSKSLTMRNHFIAHLYPFSGQRDYPYGFERILKEIITRWRVEIIVIGNGVGSQDVRKVVNNIVSLPEFSRVRYVVISEQGVSEYSVSKEAEQEYPGYTPEVISSISLVKRFFNPLHEYVKVEPTHLGIGMYQHDIDKKKLAIALQEVVSEIVSIVGVDLNTASLPLLKSVSGLTSCKAKAIISHRKRRGGFKNRKELLEVEGIDYSTFEQCAGFVRIIPPSNVASRNEYNLLDQTIIHPEHYESTHRLLKFMGLPVENIGTPDFIKRVKGIASSGGSLKVSEKLGIDVETTKLLIHALSMPLNQDIRSMATPLDLKTSMRSMHDLQVGTSVTGQVENVTTFGAFVDIGVDGVSGLLYFKYHKKLDIGLGDTIEAEIVNLEVDRGRIGLKLKRKISDLFPMNNLI